MCQEQIKLCDECDSEYYSQSSKMDSLCPHCAHVLYGYEDCEHNFKDGRCTKCYWNGAESDYIKHLEK